MIAVVKIGGHQAIVEPGDVIQADKLDVKPDTKINLETLLISDDDGSNFQAGDPVLKGVSVEAKVLSHERSGKITVFKMKPRKRYRKKLGHRQDYSVLEILDIKSGTAKTAPKTTDTTSPAKEASVVL